MPVRAALVLLCCPLLSPADDLRTNEMRVGGGSAEADGLRVGGPSIVLRRSAPGTVVALVQPPGAPPRYAYVLLVRGDEGRTVLAQYDGRSRVEGPRASSSGFLDIAGRKVAFAYTFTTDANGRPAEGLAIDGRPLDLAKGRVVLVDLGSDRVTWQQSAAPLPAGPMWPTTTDDVEAQGRAVVRHLSKADKNVRDFLR